MIAREMQVLNYLTIDRICSAVG